MVTSYDFPAEHWQHIQTTNSVDSSLATLQLRTDAAERVNAHLSDTTPLMGMRIVDNHGLSTQVRGGGHVVTQPVA